MIKFLHSADFHFSKENQVPALQSLEVFADTGIDQGVDLYMIAGDLFDRAIQNTASSGLPELQRVIQRMMNQAPVVAVTGTPTHDIAGAYEFLEQTYAEHSFTLLDPRTKHFLMDGEIITDPCAEDVPDLLILGCPEASKEWFLADKSGLSRDEATQAVIKGMRDIFLGFAATRKEYPESPCLFVYHGEVSGASMCNGQILPSGGIAVGRDDLAMIGFDYGALGHLHKAQQIGNLPAYYAGSAFPVNWGETDTKQFNLVRLGGENELVVSMPYPHPPRKKIVCEKVDLFAPGELKGYQVWAVIRGDKEDLATFDTDRALRDMLTAGALPGSRVTTEIIPVETVRAGEIQEAKSLWEKFCIYFTNSGEEEKLTGALRAKIEQLEAEARKEGRAVVLHDWWMESARLRGAIGIKKGLGLDEVFIDFSRFAPGIIGLFGDNGTGKTTLEENLHPFSCFISRAPATPSAKGRLQDGFLLRDSAKEIIYIDKITDEEYRFFIDIDGATASGSCEYHITKDGVPIVNGRKADYDQKVEELFGSIAMFKRSAIIGQKFNKHNPSLADATDSERKEIYCELAGIDYYKGYTKAASDTAKAIENDTERDRGRIEALTATVARIPELEHDRDRLQVELEEKELARDGLKTQGTELKAKSDELQVIIDENRRIETRTGELNRQVEELTAANTSLESEREGYKTALDRQAAAEYELQEYDKLRARKEVIENERTKALQERDTARAEYDVARTAVEDIDKELRKNCEKIRTEISEERQVKAQKSEKIDNLDAVLQQPIDTTCPTCRQNLPTETAERLKGEREKVKADFKALQSEVFDLDQDIIAFENALKKLQGEADTLKWPEVPTLAVFDDFELSGINDELSHIVIDEIRGTIDKAKTAAAKIESIGLQVAANCKKIASLLDEAEALESNYNHEVDEEFQTVTRQLDKLREEYQDAKTAATRIETELKGVEKQLTELEATRLELEALKEDLGKKVSDAQEWRLVERSCGPKGIQALELDAIAPEVNELASDFLKVIRSYYDKCPFDAVRINTTKIVGSGSQVHQDEDFAILVHDTRDDTEVPIEKISGGEDVWITRAIYDAFGIVRRKNVGVRFLTALRDEADGALQVEAKTAYYRLLERAHQESGCIHTLAITHSPDIQEMIGQRINMTELEARVKEAVA